MSLSELVQHYYSRLYIRILPWLSAILFPIYQNVSSVKRIMHLDVEKSGKRSSPCGRYIKTVNTAAGEKRIRFARKKYILVDF
jgi:hypothetical protein